MKRLWSAVFFLILCSMMISCLPKNDSLAQIDPNEPDPVEAENWSNDFYTGKGSTHGVQAPRWFGIGPRKSTMKFSLSDEVPTDLKSLRWSEVHYRVSGLPGKSSGNCARGVKDTLAKLLGRSPVSSDGIDACEITESYLNENFSGKGQIKWSPEPLTNIAKDGLKPGDVIVCNRDVAGAEFDDTIPCPEGAWGKLSGHIEFVDSNKGITSDFTQKGSGCLSNSRYHQARVYRMASNTAVALLQIWMKQITLEAFLIRSAHATEPAKAKALTNSTQSQAIRLLLVKTDSYEIYEEEPLNDVNVDSSAFAYRVYQRQNDRWVDIAQSDLSAFHALEALPNVEAKKLLADLLVSQAVKEYGRARMQEKILGRVFFSTIEKSAYVEAGFSIPDFYKIKQG